jgi:hypothetical protein
MSLKYSKWLTLTYFVLSILGAFLLDIGKISRMPISLGITFFIMIFAWKAISGFFSEQETPKVDLLVYWGIMMQLSIQGAVLFLKTFRYEIVNIGFLVFFAVLFIIYRYKTKKELVLLSVLISMGMCTYYFNFKN